ncbi:MAG: hypothetical protein JF616_21030 [Fibrobacteres bacterium]|jgi:hypothetical protein|nr:hypothetical protein [Fibrobacterota bacterium]
MTLSKTLSTLSLAGAMVAAVALSPSDAAAGFGLQTVVTGVVGGSKVVKPAPKPHKNHRAHK